jgi:hypothetical protein
VKKITAAFFALSAIAAAAGAQASYLQRGDSVEHRYTLHREQLEQFFKVLDAQFAKVAPELRPKLTPPADLPYGYQILPTLSPTAAWTPKPARIVLSPFSWNRTDSMIDRGHAKLVALQARYDSLEHLNEDLRRALYPAIADDYRKLVEDQKLMASTVSYNRFWQAEIARQPQFYQQQKKLQAAALSRERIQDSITASNESARADLKRRVDSLSVPIDSAIKKLPAPDFVRVEHPNAHRWTVYVPVFTDITDSVFLNRFQSAIQDAWHIRDGDDEFVLLIEMHRVAIAQLYPKGDAPAIGAHIDIQSHLARFPAGGVIVTTGGNGIYATGRSIIIGPHAIQNSALVHEFGHMLGFKDGYFRSYEDRGKDGFLVLEVILDPESIVATPEHGHVRRVHFEQIIN